MLLVLQRFPRGRKELGGGIRSGSCSSLRVRQQPQARHERGGEKKEENGDELEVGCRGYWRLLFSRADVRRKRGGSARARRAGQLGTEQNRLGGERMRLAKGSRSRRSLAVRRTSVTHGSQQSTRTPFLRPYVKCTRIYNTHTKKTPLGPVCDTSLPHCFLASLLLHTDPVALLQMPKLPFLFSTCLTTDLRKKVMIVPRGSVVVPDWHKTQEAKEYIGALLRQNQRKFFGERPLGEKVTQPHTVCRMGWQGLMSTSLLQQLAE